MTATRHPPASERRSPNETQGTNPKNWFSAKRMTREMEPYVFAPNRR